MTTPALISPIGTLLSAVTACACAKLRDMGRPVCDCCLIHTADVLGGDSADDCSCPDTDATSGAVGRLMARVLQTSPVNSANLPASSRCSQTELEVVMQLGVFRCIDIPTDGAAPTCSVSTAEALGFLADEQILRAAVACCPVKQLPGRWVLTPGQWDPHGPQGGIAGGVITVRAYGAITFPKPLTEEA